MGAALALILFFSHAHGDSEEIALLLKRIEVLESRLADLEAQLTAQTTTGKCRQEHHEAPSTAAPSPEPVPLTPIWNNSLEFQSATGAFHAKVGGRLHLDYAFIEQSRGLRRAFGRDHDMGEFRRTRLGLYGRLYDSFSYRMEFDFANDGLGKFTDVWMQLENIPYFGAMRAGHFREPIGLDEQTSSNHITFMERNLATALLPGRNLGIMVHNHGFDERLNWAVGIFKDVGAFPGSQDAGNGYAFSGRLFGLPWYRDNGRRLLHLGMSYSQRRPDGNAIGYKTRPEINLAVSYLDTEAYLGFRLRDIDMQSENLVNLEAALVYGPFSMQGEYVRDQIRTRSDGSPSFSGYYLEASYIITGEHRNYQRIGGTFSRLTPRRNFTPNGADGWGAWQIALRRSRLNLSSGMIRGGEAENWTVGLNWQINPNVRLMLNYISADIQHDLYKGRVNSVQSRFQFDF